LYGDVSASDDQVEAAAAAAQVSIELLILNADLQNLLGIIIVKMKEDQEKGISSREPPSSPYLSFPSPCSDSG